MGQLGFWGTDKSQSWVYLQESGLISPRSISQALLNLATLLFPKKEAQTGV